MFRAKGKWSRGKGKAAMATMTIGMKSLERASLAEKWWVSLDLYEKGRSGGGEHDNHGAPEHGACGWLKVVEQGDTVYERRQ